MSETNFLWFLSAGIVAAVAHALLPNHWFPFVASARFHKWTSLQLFRFTLLVALAHAITTIGLSIVLGLMGESLVHFLQENSVKVASVVLLALAAFFFFSPSLYGHHHIHHYECEHCHNSRQIVTLASLFIALALSPCEGLVPVFFAASVKFGWLNALTIALASSSITVVLIVTIVLLAHKGWEKFLPQLGEQHERVLASGIIAVLGILMFFDFLH